MRVVRLPEPGIEKLSLTQEPDLTQPAPGEILVRIGASSLNFHDLAVVAGHIPVAANIVPLSDGAGTIVAVGEGVSEFKAGDRVVSTFFPGWSDGPVPRTMPKTIPGDNGDGFARDLVSAPAHGFTLAPQGYSDVEAATITCAGVTAWRCLVPAGQIKAGDTVLVMGSGGVSIYALQIAKAMGARVIATSSSDEKLARMVELGADEIINYREEPKWGSRAKALSGGGVDIVVEVGGAATMAQSIEATRNGGTISLIGVLAGVQGPVPTARIFTKQVNIAGISVGSRQHQRDLVRALETTGIRPIIGNRFPLEALQEAFAMQAAGGHFGKIGIEF
ncbi:zinc-dependent alcohol dehydrogenase family protein [Sphingobium estronivorans]|uniref:zinc-dependent alcohol dehydrogenase family protein n=1 Tax=Sphingobium estronivorans TaxID=1577690 RepID=UPI0012386380|nr:NAD(P)-dependent alcohol dehydrogenase [Sphingobium estronivorans]